MSAGGGVQRVLLLIIPMFLLALQLLVGLRLPRADHAGSTGAFKDGVAFTVISIEPERRSARQTGSLDFLRDETGASRGYEDENEMPIGDRVRANYERANTHSWDEDKIGQTDPRSVTVATVLQQ